MTITEIETERLRNSVYRYCAGTICEECKLRVGGWEHEVSDCGCLSIGDSDWGDLQRAVDIIDGTFNKCCDNDEVEILDEDFFSVL